ncbi:MAG: SDR family oxidoreductase, partial [Simkaniaceae bacterium]|nr:SDR family oxidoreductase [Simkaniaceae bacterium]
GDYVVIHDAVRPFVSHEILKNNIDAAIKYGAVDTCIPSTDTLVYAPSSDSISKIPNRADYMRGQTPQSFNRQLILKAHERTIADNSTDDCQLILAMDHHVHIVEGCQQNIKITTLMDLFVSEQILRMKREAVQDAKSIDVAGKTYLVTGGTSGIGMALVKELERYGAKALPIGRTAKKYSADLTDKKQSKKLFERIYQEHGAVDGLINCIGLLTKGAFDAQSDEMIREMIDVNYLAPIDACRRTILKPGAHIVNLSSSSFFRGRADYALYSSLKAAIVNFTQAYADEHPDLCVNAIVPQRTNTPMRWKNFPGEDPSTLLEPLEVATTIINLLSQKEATGTVFEVKKRTPITAKV